MSILIGLIVLAGLWFIGTKFQEAGKTEADAYSTINQMNTYELGRQHQSDYDNRLFKAFLDNNVCITKDSQLRESNI